MRTREVEIRHFHLFCGLGGGAKGLNAGRAEAGGLRARFRCIGGVDVDPAAIRDFGTMAGVPGTVLDMFDRAQYRSFHGKNPPTGWLEATPQDIQRAAGNERPHIVFLSAPCKGFSGLLSEDRSKTARYQALNRLTVRGVFLMLEAFSDDPPELILFENVPRIANRGRKLIDQIKGMLEAYGYAVAETTHDCGELGGLGQSRKRFLLVARHREKVPPFLYEPEKRSLRSVGEVIGAFPIPGMDLGGPMHRVPALQWKTWVRLAFVQAGADWRSLNRLRVKDGFLQDYLIVPDMHNGVLGVNHWSEPSGVVTGNARPGTGSFSVADPRFEGHARSVQLGVRPWDRTAAAVTGQGYPGQGPFAVADPRSSGVRMNNVFRVVRYEDTSPAVTGGKGPSAGGLAVADPRVWKDGKKNHEHGPYGVVPWDDCSGAVSAKASHDNGFFSVADPRLPTGDSKCVAYIIAEDQTWHRPFTTLELAALQGLVDPEEHLELSGLSDSAWRERIGNAVPAPAAAAIASEMGRTLLMAWSGETFRLSSTPIWVRDVALALAVDLPRQELLL